MSKQNGKTKKSVSSGSAGRRRQAARRKEASASRAATAGKRAENKTARTGTARERMTLQKEESAFLGREALFLFLCLAAAVLFLANFGLLGRAGEAASRLQKGLFGIAAYVFPIYLVMACLFCFRDRYHPFLPLKIAALLLMLPVTAALLHLLFGAAEPASFTELYETASAGSFAGAAAGGAAGGLLAGVLRKVFAGIGAFLILAALLILCFVVLTEKSFISIAKSGATRARSAAEKGGRAAKARISEERVRFEARRESERFRRDEAAAERLLAEAGRSTPESPLFDLKTGHLEGSFGTSGAASGTEAAVSAELPSADPSGFVSLRKETEQPVPQKTPETAENAPSPGISERETPEAEGDREPDYFRDSVPFEETGEELYRAYGKMFTGGRVTADAASRMGYAVMKGQEPGTSQPQNRSSEVSRFAAAFPEEEALSGMSCREAEEDPGKKFSIGRDRNGLFTEHVTEGRTERTAENFAEDSAEVCSEEETVTYLHRPANPEEIHYPEWDQGVSLPQKTVPAEERSRSPRAFAEPGQVQSYSEAEEAELQEREKKLQDQGNGLQNPFLAESYYSAEPVRKEERTDEGGHPCRYGEAFEKRGRQTPAEENQPQNSSPAGTAAGVSAAEKPVRRRPYQFPPVGLLARGTRSEGADLTETRENARKLERVLAEFGVGVTVTNVVHGPRVTRYEMIPDTGVKVSRITALSDDLKLALAARELRVEAPIPGKSAVGIEVPNNQNSTVTFRDIMDTPEFRQSKSKLSWGVGLDIQGSPVIGDIAKMPHLLVSGTTGSGKSVGINSIIMSVIYRATPEEVKLILVDPKVVELSVYDGIPHLLAPVVTKPEKALAVLNKACAEMQRRYTLFKESNTRNISGYNEKAEEVSRMLKDGQEKPEKLPYILIIIDELSELMMHSKKDVESAIVSLTQLARAAGIHLVVATQRPSVDVVTGLIKSNIPSRVAYRLPSGTDSRTIIDSYGAETLLGNGDMLYKPGDKNSPLRVQGAYLSDSEVESVVSWVRKRNAASYEDEWENVPVRSASPAPEGGPAETECGEDGRDEYFREAGEFITEKKKASIGMLQRKFKVGFNRASRIMDQLNEAGVVSDGEGTKERQILMSVEEFRERAENGSL